LILAALILSTPAAVLAAKSGYVRLPEPKPARITSQPLAFNAVF
jgi:hypothetical protein